MINIRTHNVKHTHTPTQKWSNRKMIITMTFPWRAPLTPSWRRWGRRRRSCRGRWWWWLRWRLQRGRRRWWWLWWRWWRWWRWRWRRRWWWLRWPLFCWHLAHWVRHKVVTIIDALSSSSSNNYWAAAFALHSALLFIHFLHHQGAGGLFPTLTSVS